MVSRGVLGASWMTVNGRQADRMEMVHSPEVLIAHTNYPESHCN